MLLSHFPPMSPIRILLALSLAIASHAATIENRYLRVTVDPEAGQITALDKSGHHEWKQAASPRRTFRDVKATGRDSLSFTADVTGNGNKTWPATIKLAIGDAGPDLAAEIDLPDRAAQLDWIGFLDPFVLDTPSAALAVSDYADGHLYPLNLRPLPKSRFPLDNIDMPWVGVVDVDHGFGYAVIADTPDDGYFELRPVPNAQVSAPRLVWTSSSRTFRYPRRAQYYFAARGGYVALAKRYREYARSIGVLATFTEKLKRNPNLSRLFGAPDVWGDGSLRFAQEVHAAGVEKMLQHTSGSEGVRRGITPEDMKAINALGYLTSTYDVYADILPLEPGHEVTPHTDRIPENVVLRADGQRMTAWLTWDKKQYMKRCPALWEAAARQCIPHDLALFPYIGRFIDVITAENLYECFDPAHPLTRTAKREANAALLRYVRSLGLVVGSEHGRWWAVPQVDYIEGMMSGGFASWPAGHLIRPKAKEDTFDNPNGSHLPKWDEYAKWGIGHEYRIPLWELVFHDCIVSTWYWGDSSDFLLAAAPEITPKKDAFNILYGTIPMMWAGRNGSWPAARDTFLTTYRNTSKLHETIATAEMLSHAFVTPDRAVQETRFADGTRVLVNFGAQPYTATVAGHAHVLPQNGFFVKGPHIEQSMELIDGRAVTTVHAGAYRYDSRL
jgi:Glycosyl hydrolases related to GH101 family, GH129